VPPARISIEDHGNMLHSTIRSVQCSGQTLKILLCSLAIGPPEYDFRKVNRPDCMFAFSVPRARTALRAILRLLESTILIAYLLQPARQEICYLPVSVLSLRSDRLSHSVHPLTDSITMDDVWAGRLAHAKQVLRLGAPDQSN
jgi:hypothetical protein